MVKVVSTKEEGKNLGGVVCTAWNLSDGEIEADEFFISVIRESIKVKLIMNTIEHN